MRRGGVIGKHAWLRTMWGNSRESSSLSRGTKICGIILNIKH